jgi:L-threonylcarbamoyladenylate synthase
MAAKVVAVDARQPDPALLERAATILRAGGLVIVPTSGLYGLAAVATDQAAVSRVAQAKGRPADKPILVLISRLSHLTRISLDMPPTGHRLMETFWPGGVTLVVKARPGLSQLLISNGKVGMRQVAHHVTAALIDRLGVPVTGTSANRSGQPAAASVADLSTDIIAAADIVLDAGSLAGGLGSTVVDVSADSAEVLRKGTVSRQEILRALEP